MENLMQGQASRTNGALSHPNPAPNAANLSAHRRSLLDTLAGAPLITTAEYDTAVQRILACQSLETLQKWYRNAVREIARREEELPAAEAAAAPAGDATPAQREEIAQLLANRVITRPERTKVLLRLNRLTGPVAVALIGDLYQKVLDRGGVVPARGPAPGTTYPHLMAPAVRLTA